MSYLIVGFLGVFAGIRALGLRRRQLSAVAEPSLRADPPAGGPRRGPGLRTPSQTARQQSYRFVGQCLSVGTQAVPAE